ncbi:MAG: sporulation protein YtfJ [Clostridia bacterium]|nr:sporulation protein YtfJ [Clostridia bacterium]
MEIKENSNLSELIGNSLKSLKELSDSETIVGSPIVTASGVTVIPVSKLSMGFVGGGLDYGKKLKAKPDVKEYSEGKPNFGGGGGTGVSLVPVAFLVISVEGKVSVLPIVNEASNDTFTKLVEQVPAIAEKVKSFFADKKKKKQTEAAQDEAFDEPSEDVEEEGE